VASVVLTMIVGFSWGGWVTGGTAALKEERLWQRGEYVGKQGWATMPGEQAPDRRVAEMCATLLMPSS
jgi:hypothetical protein